MKKYKFSLRNKFTIYITGVLLLSSLSFFIFTFSHEKSIIFSLFTKKNIALAKSYALSIKNKLNTGNDLELDDVSQLYSKEESVVAAYVLDSNGRYISHNNPSLLGEKHPLYKILTKGNKLDKYYLAVNDKGTLVYIFYYPVNNNLIANIEVRQNFIKELLLNFLSKFTLIFLLLLFIAIIIARVIAKYLSNPIKELTKGVEIISQGNFDYTIPNKYNDEIGLLTEEFNSMTKKIKEIQKLNILKERIKRELEIAAEIQKKLIPDKKIDTPNNYKIEHYYSPAIEIGGDYYDFFKISKNKLGIVLADVSGKGIPAAIVMSMIKTIFSSLNQVELTPKEILSIANLLLRKNIKKSIFVPTFYGILDIEKNSFKFAMAGCEKLILFNKKTKKITIIKTSGYPLGLQPEKEFKNNLEGKTINLKTNDCIFLYTDGLTDIKNKDSKEFFDIEGITNFLKNYNFDNDNFTEKLLKYTINFRGTNSQEDDISFILICKGK